MDQFDAAARQVVGGDDAFDQAAGSVVDDGRTKLRASLYSGLMENPDQAARAQAIGKQAGLPRDVVQRNLPEVERGLRFEAVTAAVDEAPTLSRWLSEQDNAAISHDNIENMGQIERKLRQFGGGFGEAVGMSASGTGVLADVMQRTVINDFASIFLPEPQRGPMGLEPQKPTIESLAGPLIGEGWREAGGAVKDFARNDVAGAGEKTFADQVAGGLGQVVGQIALLPLARGMGLYAQGADVMNEKIVPDMADQRMKDLAILGGAAVTGVTEAWALDKLLGPMAVPVKNQIGAALARIGIASAAEGGQEFSENVLQDTIRKALTNRDAEINLGQSIEEGGVGAAVGGIVRTIVESALHIRARGGRKAEQAEQGAQTIAELSDLAKADKVLQRNPDAFEAFIKQAAEDGPVPTVYIDAQTLMQSGVVDQIANVSASVAEQLETAVATGGQIAIPVEEFAARIAPTEFAQGLLDHIRTEPDGFTRAEAQQYMQSQAEELQADVERTLTEKQGDATFQQSQDAVKAAIQTELDTLGRFTPEKNEADATLFASYYAVRAAQLGVTPEQFYEQRRVRFAAQSIAGQQFDQAATVEGMPENQAPGPQGDAQQGATQGNAVTAEQEEANQPADGFTRLYHAGSDPVKGGYFKEVPSGGVFDGMFSLRGRWGNYGTGAKYFADVAEDKVLTQHDLDYEIDYDKASAALRNVMPWVEEQDFDTAWSAVIEEKADRIDEDDLLRIMQESDIGAAKWEAQRRRGMVAKALGYQAVEMDDENGTSILIVSGTPLTRVIQNDESAPDTDGAYNQGARGAFSPESLTITLLKGADLSSALHEGAHFFFENDIALAAELVAQQDAALTEGERQIVADVSALMSFHGITGTVQEQLAQWYMMDFEQKRVAHERTAESFEKYLFEGTAPSLELAPYFQKFRAWMLSVYKSLKQFLAQNPEAGKLDDTVRQVFDRMLATSEQIKLAEQGRSMLPLFATLEESGMTVGEFAAYQANGNQPTADAIDELQAKGLRDMQWLRNARGRELKRLQKQAAVLRSEARIDARREVMSQPVYKAWQFLTAKEVDGGPAVGNLDAAALQDMGFTTEETQRLRDFKMVRTEGGMHPDAVAEASDFTSGDEMVRALIAAEKPTEAIEALTDKLMIERHGELSTPEAIEQAADAAIHNAARARMIATEYNAMARTLESTQQTGTDRRGRPIMRQILPDAARAFARNVIARLKVRDVKPSQYANAASRAGQNAMRAQKAGDMGTAAAEKRNQLLQTIATREAHNAREEIDRGVGYLRKFEKSGVRKSLDFGYVDQIDALLERFDLKKSASLKDIDKRQSLAAWITAQREAGMEPEISERLENEAFRTSYKDLTVEEFRGVVEAVKQIEHLGRLKRKLLTAKDAREFRERADEATATIIENGGEARPLELEGERGVKPWLEGLQAGHRKLASLLRQMDGGKDGGVMWELLGRSMNERATMEAVANERATMALTEIFKPVLALKGGLNGDLKSIPEIKNSLTRGGRLSVALNWGNEANRQRIMDGDQWTDAQVKAILRTLTPVEAQFVNQVWEHIDTYWPDVAAKEKRMMGKEPEKVLAQPFDMVLADGSVAQMRGGYYPLKYDAARDDRAEKHDAVEVAKDMMRGAFTRATTRRGHTKARAEQVKRPVRKSLDVITQHVTQVTHDLAWHEWLVDANRVVDDSKINQAIRDFYGPAVIRTIKDNIAAIATADVVPQTQIDKAMLYLRSNISRSTMGWSLTTAFLQPFGLTQSMVRIGPKHVLRGMARWAGDMARFQSGTAWVYERSDFMRLRDKTFNRELNEINGRINQGKSTARQIYDASLFVFMQKMQKVADIPTWIGQYEKAMEQGADEATAIAQADQAVLDSQGGGQTKDMAELQRKHPMLSMFYSYFNVTYNLAAESTAKTDFKSPMAVAGWLSDMALLMIVPALGPAIVLELLRGGGDDEPEEWAKKLLEWQSTYLLGTMLGLRELSGVAAGFDYTGPPVGRVIGDIGKAGTQVVQGEADEALGLSVVRLFGSALGIPTVQLVRSWRGWNAWSEGDAPATAVLLGPPPP